MTTKIRIMKNGLISKNGNGYSYMEFEDENGVHVSLNMDEFGTPIVSKEKLIDAMVTIYTVSTLTWFSMRSKAGASEDELKVEWKGRMDRFNKIKEEVEELIE